MQNFALKLMILQLNSSLTKLNTSYGSKQTQKFQRKQKCIPSATIRNPENITLVQTCANTCNWI